MRRKRQRESWRSIECLLPDEPQSAGKESVGLRVEGNLGSAWVKQEADINGSHVQGGTDGSGCPNMDMLSRKRSPCPTQGLGAFFISSRRPEAHTTGTSGQTQF